MWIRRWRDGGFDALVPHPRQSAPRTPPEVIELAAALKKENPARTAAQVQRILKAQSGWAPDDRRGDLSVTEVCFAVGCASLGTFSTRFTELAGMPPGSYRSRAAGATAGMPPCVAKQVTRPVRNREAPVTGPRLA